MTELSGQRGNSPKQFDNSACGIGIVSDHHANRIRYKRISVNVDDEFFFADHSAMEKIHVTQRLKDIRQRAGLSMQELAKAMGYRNSSSYQRYEDPSLTRDDSLPIKFVQKLLPVVTGKGAPAISDREIMELVGPLLATSTTEQMEVSGRVAAGIWQDLDETSQTPLGYLPVQNDRRYAGRHQYALLVDGESMNKILPSGTYVVVVEAFGRSPRHDDLVVVRRNRSGLIERTVKRVNIDNGTVEFRPESTSESFKPLILEGNADETQIEIEAYVVGSYRPL